ncbi:MAG: SURF1 family protein [Pseudomonadota bacterium]|nr:SURF1 family protein [Pseudomonadota bacterium]
MKLGSRIFEPRPFTSTVTVGLLALLVSLGFWQLRRADQKKALYDAFDKGADTVRTLDGRTTPMPRYQHAEAHGRYDSAVQILIDNMTDADGRAGYYVITPLALKGGGWLLVNRGWTPLGPSRASLPDVAVSDAERSVRGRADHLPAAGIRMGQPTELRPPSPIVANFPDHRDIELALPGRRWTRATDVLLLDPDQSDGYVRQWHAPGIPPVRHIAYAVQWFGLAAALAGIYIATNLRRAPKPAAPA